MSISFLVMIKSISIGEYTHFSWLTLINKRFHYFLPYGYYTASVKMFVDVLSRFASISSQHVRRDVVDVETVFEFVRWM